MKEIVKNKIYNEISFISKHENKLSHYYYYDFWGVITGISILLAAPRIHWHLKLGNLIKRWHLMDPCRLNYKHDQCLAIDPSINISNDYLLSTIKKTNFDMNPSNKVWYFIKTTIQHRVRLMVEGLKIN